jgi:hypothetical protein
VVPGTSRSRQGQTGQLNRFRFIAN